MTRTPFLDDAIAKRPMNHDEKPRRMGVEIELAGLKGQALVEILTELFGGSANWQSPYEVLVEGTDVGVFKVELDSQGVKDLGTNSTLTGDPTRGEQGIEKAYLDAVESVSSQVVPWEIVSPPIEFADLHRLFDLIKELRARGAKGTKSALYYAFGVHLNPELNDVGASHIVNHLKSFFCLFEWIMSVERPDLARRVTPYINHFEPDYIKLILAADYQPSETELIDDYLEHNPTRNRNLDMLPLFAFLDEERVRAAVDDARVNARPTFHYRLPNSEVSMPDWNLDQTFETWFAVERFAVSDDLQQHCDDYLAQLNQLLPVSKSAWAKRMGNVVDSLREKLDN